MANLCACGEENLTLPCEIDEVEQGVLSSISICLIEVPRHDLVLQGYSALDTGGFPASLLNFITMRMPSVGS